MTDPQLEKYIRECREQNMSEKEITNNLRDHDWPAEMIADALQKVSLPDAVPKNRIPKAIPILLCLLAIPFFQSAIASIGMVFVLNQAITRSGGVPFMLFKSMFYILILPLAAAFCGVIYIYTAMRVASGSRKARETALVSLLLVPANLAIGFFIGMKIAKMATVSGTVRGPAATADLFAYVLFNPTTILGVIILLLLIGSFGRFRGPDSRLYSWQKAVMGILILVFVFPGLLLPAWAWYSLSHNDYGYAKAQKQVGYHIYRPADKLGDREIATTYMSGKKFAGKNNAIKLAYDMGFDDLIRGNKPVPIMINQVGVDPGFDIDKFIKDEYKDKYWKRQAVTSLQTKGKAYLVGKPIGDKDMESLVYLTNDNVLVTLVSTDALSNEIIALAETLR